MRQNLRKYDPQIYPRKLWVATSENVQYLIDTFTFFSTIDLKKVNDNTAKELLNPSSSERMIAAVYPVMHNKTTEYGALVIIFDISEFTTGLIGHEAVHVADYICDELGIYTDSLANNEHYAYLVGWVAGKISEYLIDIE